MRPLLQEGRRAVDRIDDERAVPVEPREVLAGFLGKPPVIRPRDCESLAEVFFDGDVGFGYRFAAVLAPAPVLFSVKAPCNLSRFPHSGFDEDEILIHRQRSYPPRAGSARWCRNGR